VLRAELRPIFATRTRSEWLEILQQHEVPSAPVNTVGEALEDEQMRHLGLIDSLTIEDVGRMPLIRPPALWDGAVLDDVRRAPFLDEHREEILAGLSR
jgi:crotonobetainyl-CoA:carnitine CoA-transferase CaiB-like acyl-CoA transferase